MNDFDKVPNLDKALAEIGDIRATIAAGTIFQGFGPVVIASTGGLAVLVAMVQSIWPQTFASSPEVFLGCWIVTAVVAWILIGVEMLARSRRIHGGLADAMLLNAVEHFLPAGVAGAALTAVLFKYAPEQLWMLPGTWQVLVALGIFAAARTLPRSVNIAAAWYFVAGIAALIALSGEKTLLPWAMGAPFAIGQFILAIVLRFAKETNID